MILGNQTSSNDPGTYRDAGFESNIGNTFSRLYADTIHCDPADVNLNCNAYAFRAKTIAQSTSNPQVVTGFASPYPSAFCASSVDDYRFHLSNIVSPSSTTGAAYYANISGDTSKDIDGAAIGSEVAMISYSGFGSPKCTILP